MRMMFKEAFNEEAPSVKQFHDEVHSNKEVFNDEAPSVKQLHDEVHSNASQHIVPSLAHSKGRVAATPAGDFNWMRHLSPRELDVLQMHLLAYLVPAFQHMLYNLYSLLLDCLGSPTRPPLKRPSAVKQPTQKSSEPTSNNAFQTELHVGHIFV